MSCTNAGYSRRRRMTANAEGHCIASTGAARKNTRAYVSAIRPGIDLSVGPRH